MLHIGAWVDGRIRKSVIDAAAASAAHYMERSVRPHIQALDTQRELSVAEQTALAGLIEAPKSTRGILEIRIWLPDGRLAFASTARPDNPKHNVSAEVTAALSGQVVAHFDDAKNVWADNGVSLPVFNVYAPAYGSLKGRPIAVVEFFQDATTLSREFTIARQQSWLLVGSLTVGMLALLFSIVHRGSLQIFDQQQALTAKVAEQARLLKQNETLRSRLTRANQSSHLVSDKLLRRVGADLHDGPAQLLSLALLRLDELAPTTGDRDVFNAGQGTLDAIRSATQGALAEIRTISSGLSLPQIEHLSPGPTIDLAIDNHERWTRTSVTRDIEALPELVNLAARTCLFRVVQEGLNNAFHHADGRGQRVHAHADGGSIHLVVQDDGPGFAADALRDRSDALGLAGLRHRVESLGGFIEILSAPGQGTKISATIPAKAPHD